MRRRGVIGIEISPEGVRAVALSDTRQVRLLAWAEKTISTQDEVPAALNSILAELAITAPIDLVLFGADARLSHFRLPNLSESERQLALDTRRAQLLDENPTAFLATHFAYPPDDEGNRDYCFFGLPREPLATWFGMLAAEGCPVESVTTPGTQTINQVDIDHNSRVLWVSLGGSRTGLSFLKQRQLVLTREVPSRILAADDPVAAVEKRLADFQEIERSLRFYRQTIDPEGVTRVVLSGAREETSPLKEQLAPPLKELGVEIELNDPWDGIEYRGLIDPLAAARLSSALLAAKTRCRRLAIVPESTVKKHRASRKRVYLLLAAAALTIAAGGLGIATLSRNHRRMTPSEDAGKKPRPASSAQVEKGRQQEKVQDPPIAARPTVPNWSGVLRQAGLLARPGIDYERLVLTLTEEGPVLGFEGLVDGESTHQAGLLMAALHESLFSSPYSSSLPRLAARSDTPEGNSERVRFAIESVVSSQTDHGSRNTKPTPPPAAAVLHPPFATWSHLVAGLHEAAGHSMLERFNYETGTVTPFPDVTTPSYRAMHARVTGAGPYKSIVNFVDALAQVTPPLILDELIISEEAGGPRFDIRVHLVTSLPVEEPRVINLGHGETGSGSGVRDAAQERGIINLGHGKTGSRSGVKGAAQERGVINLGHEETGSGSGVRGGPRRFREDIRSGDCVEDPDYRVTVILWNLESPVAQVSGQVVEVGDVLGAFVVERIDPEGVVLAHKDGNRTRWIAELGGGTRRIEDADVASPGSDQ